MSRIAKSNKMRWSSRQELSTHSAISCRNLRSISVCHARRSRRGVTIVEVLFAMFVVLFGLVGLVVLLPMAARQASDSYVMTQGGALMDNVASEIISSKSFEPTSERGWWYADDYLAPLNYNVANSMGALYTNLQNNIRVNTTHRSFPNPPTSQLQIQQVVRESYAYGFCIDPLFCADQFISGWRYSTAYTHQRKSATQLLFRRSRMPFFDEHAFLVGNFITGAVDFGDLDGVVATSAAAYAPVAPLLFPSNSVEFPRLIRVSFPSGTFATGQPLPISTPMAEKIVAAMGDLVQVDPTDDKSYGSLRGFQSTGAAFSASPNNVNLTWMITLTPSERTPTGVRPTQFDLSFVIMNRRDRTFDAAPTGVTGAETYPKDEKIAIATSPIGTVSGPFPPNVPNNALEPFWTLPGAVSLLDLPQSTGGTLDLKLWGAQLTDPKIRIGDWVMLSRKISLGDVNPPTLANTNYNPKLIHRHRWYRVIGIDSNETWPRQIRVAGDVWDYPEANGGPNAFNPTNASHLRAVLTTVTICPSVEMVYKKVISLD